MENKQTAVQWLQDKLFELEIKIDPSIAEETFFLFAQAKIMEKEQIINAYNYNMTGFDKLEQEEIGLDWANDYYNETYNKKDHA
jgi:hypothetical protein